MRSAVSTEWAYGSSARVSTHDLRLAKHPCTSLVWPMTGNRLAIIVAVVKEEFERENDLCLYKCKKLSGKILVRRSI